MAADPYNKKRDMSMMGQLKFHGDRFQKYMQFDTPERDELIRVPEQDLATAPPTAINRRKPNNDDGVRRGNGQPMMMSPNTVGRQMSPTAARDAGLTRVVKTGKGVYTDAPGAIGEERLYDAIGNRADTSFDAAGITSADLTPAQFYAKQNASKRAPDEVILQRGENAQGVRRRYDEGVAAKAAQQRADFELAATGKRAPNPAEVEAALQYQQSQTAMNLANAEKTDVGTARAIFDGNAAAEKAAREAAEYDPLAADRQAVIQGVFGGDPTQAATIAQRLGFDNADEAIDVLAFERAAQGMNPASFDINKSATAARAIGSLQRKLGGEIDSASSLNPFDKRRFPGNNMGNTGGLPDLASLRFADGMYEQDEGFYLEHAPEGADSRAAFMEPSAGELFGDRDRLQRLLQLTKRYGGAPKG